MTTLISEKGALGRSLFATLALIGGAAFGSEAQPNRKVIVPDEVSCRSCSIEITTLGLRGTAQVPLPDWPTDARVDSQGRFWVFSDDMPARIFDASGRFIRLIGQNGSGPNEYRPLGMLLQLDRDSLAVLDFNNARISILAPDLRMVRTVPSDLSPGDVLGLTGNRFIATGLVRSPNSIGYAVHIVEIPAHSMKIQRSFGGSGEVSSPVSGGVELAWHLAASTSGRFWTSERLAYRMRLWDVTGATYIEFERKPSWFVPQTRVWLGNQTTPPKPMGVGLSEDGGVLWTFTHVADPDWRKAWPNVPAEGESRGPAVEDVVDTVIEAIDIASGKVLARTKIPHRVIRSLPGGRVLTFYHDNNSAARLELRTLRIRR